MQSRPPANSIRSLDQGERAEFRRILDEIRSQKRASNGQVTARQAIQSRLDEFTPSMRAALEGVMERDAVGPEVGGEPQDFFLKRLDSQERVRLSGFQGESPVAIVFGSYT